MLEVSFLDEIVMEKTRETAQQYIVTVLEARFGDVPGDVVEGIESIDDQSQATELLARPRMNEPATTRRNL